VWLSLGCYPEHERDTGRNYLTHYIVNQEGNIVTRYRKMHMFDVNLDTRGGVN